MAKDETLINDSNLNESTKIKTDNINPKEGEIQQKSHSLEELLTLELENAKFPDALTVVSGKLDPTKIAKIAEAGIEHIINLQPEEELDFDEKSEVENKGIHYTHLPIAGAKDLKQINLLAFDKALRAHHGKKTLIHCGTGNRVGACMALRAGWLRGRKMDTAITKGKEHGMTSLEEEVRIRLLVPR